MAGRVTIVDVAKLAGTSTASVSYFLNGKLEKLGKPTQDRIAAAIRETGYVPNAQAQALSGKPTHVLGQIILDNTNLWAGQIQSGVESAAREAGYQIVVCGTNFDRETEQSCVEKLLSLGVDGFIIQPTSNFRAVHERIKRAGRPVVFFDCDTFDLSTSWIKANLYDGVYSAIQQCIEMGYERFITVAAPLAYERPVQDQVRARERRVGRVVRKRACHGAGRHRSRGAKRRRPSRAPQVRHLPGSSDAHLRTEPMGARPRVPGA